MSLGGKKLLKSLSYADTLLQVFYVILDLEALHVGPHTCHSVGAWTALGQPHNLGCSTMYVSKVHAATASPLDFDTMSTHKSRIDVAQIQPNATNVSTFNSSSETSAHISSFGV